MRTEFSEGVDMGVIEKITQEIENVEGVKLLDVDPGKADKPHGGHLCGDS